MDIGTEQLDQQERDERLAEYRKREQDAALGDLLHVMSTIEGRRFVDMLRRDTGIRALSFQPGDDRATAFNEGRRSVGLDLEARLLHPEVLPLFEQLEKEHRDRIRLRNSYVAR